MVGRWMRCLTDLDGQVSGWIRYLGGCANRQINTCTSAPSHLSAASHCEVVLLTDKFSSEDSPTERSEKHNQSSSQFKR